MTYRIVGETGEWEVVIGLEVHAQVVSNSKLFSGASTEFGGAPNTHVSLVDAAMPGMLPVVNEKCIEQAVRTGLGLKAKINNYSVFARKNYFYADLPQSYQISQFDKPIVGAGVVILDMPDGTTREIGIERLHLEQDAGKSMHDQDPKRTFVDLNRSGVALMEIVSDPDMRSPEEAGIYVRKIRSIVRYLETCDGNMEQGSMRADVNVSVRKVGSTELNTRCEIKNVNSVRFVMQAIEAEAQRQVELVESGGEVEQQTRQFDPSKGETKAMRSKEFAHDYRYFPDPDLLPIEFSEEYVEAIKATLPELPDEKKQRYMSEYGLSAYDAGVLVVDRETGHYYEAVLGKNRDPKLAANWVISNLFGALKAESKSIEESPVSAEQLGQLLDLIADDTISGKIAKDVFEKMIASGDDPAVIVEKEGLKQITDTGAIEAAVDDVIANSPEQVAQFQGGNEKIAGWFVGQIMKATQGKANPGMVNKMLKEKLG
ncbi:MAG: Asp-tRNA(Asn)/Glu-tRNA(Gln) amidotransferase subunit GatB [Rhodospirillales bacterium]|jgi:aspartyl-tRNA(Asn)/glutamyl-tRNA(Gln) amidotransferase subunit B|nr:Asp-tRNA(Asn)/Glu-tRNA(Gln) amidotransferase subunit GatB [Rhodospirillales bacterium]